MPHETLSLGTHELAFQSYGVRIAMSTNDADVFERLQTFVPPGSEPCDSQDAEQRFEVTNQGRDFALRLNDEWTVEYQDLELTLGLLDTHLTGFVAVHASERIFVHAGAVAHEGRLILMPGSSFAGKSSLVAAFLSAGASYYSDDYGVLDESGRVHPYTKPVSLRNGTLEQTTYSPESFGAATGDTPLAPSLIVLASYRRGVTWAPRRLSKGEATLAVLENTLPARERPQESLRAVARAVEGAVVLQGERGEAKEVIPLLLEELEASQASSQ